MIIRVLGVLRVILSSRGSRSGLLVIVALAACSNGAKDAVPPDASTAPHDAGIADTRPGSEANGPTTDVHPVSDGGAGDGPDAVVAADTALLGDATVAELDVAADARETTPVGPRPAVCGGKATNLSEDPSHCGDCATVCSFNDYCSGGVCSDKCGASLLPVSRACVDPLTSASVCSRPQSSWFETCDANQVCKGGVCVAVCDAGQTMCNGTCATLASDNRNCGTCGHACASGTSCMYGICMPCKSLLPYPPFIPAKAPGQVAIVDLNGDRKPDLLTSGSGLGVFLGNGDGSFGAERRFDSQGGAATVLDFDGDGKLDLVQPATAAVIVRPGLGDGTFGIERSYPVPSVGRLAVVDLNRDGFLDVVVAGGKKSVYVLLGTSDHQLSAATSITLEGNSDYLAVGDLDGDGFPDAAVADSQSAYVAILFGNGDGTFKATSLTVRAGISDVAAGDLDDDGKAELVVVESGSVRVFYSTGPGLFLERGSGISVASGSLLLTDLNGDDRPDVVVTGGSTVRVLPSEVYGRTFAAVRSIDVGDYKGLAVGDVNGDGRPDLVTADSSNGKISMLLGNGPGTFARPTLRKLSDYPSGLVFGEVDGDGKPDIVLRRTGMFLISVFGSRSGYGVEQTWTIPSSAGSVIGVADLDGDGVGDIVLGNSKEKSIVFLLSLKGFSTTTNYSYDGMMAALALADFNGDGKIDFASVNADTKDVTVVAGKGNANMGTSIHYAVPGAPTQIAAVDIDGDGKLDLVMPDAAGRAITILPGVGDGTFGTARSVSTGGASWIEMGDFDGNGIVDVAALGATDSATGKSAVAVLLGTGGGAFATSKTYPYDGSPNSFSVGDIDGDGHVDLMFPNLNNDAMTFRLGRGDGTFAAPTAPYLLPLTLGTARLQDLDRDGVADIVMLDSSYNGGLGIIYGIKDCKVK